MQRRLDLRVGACGRGSQSVQPLRELTFFRTKRLLPLRTAPCDTLSRSDVLPRGDGGTKLPRADRLLLKNDKAGNGHSVSDFADARTHRFRRIITEQERTQGITAQQRREEYPNQPSKERSVLAQPHQSGRRTGCRGTSVEIACL